ncbi:phosphodiester glycosidase family protein [Marinicrinis sediminis]|uniref:Phosphodiester glycosidase family protein n=1 Tax=Marinicrinis sediminis TaxID=1652465 RepID=A0ABW5R9C6_9BACL
MRTIWHTSQSMHRFMLLAIAPFIGIFLALWMMNEEWQLSPASADESGGSPVAGQAETVHQERTDELLKDLEQSEQLALNIQSAIQTSIQQYETMTRLAGEAYQSASVQSKRPLAIYDRRVTAKLGKRIGSISSDKLHMELYPIQEKTYKGYAVKIELKSREAMKMVLGKDRMGSSENTLQAVKRYRAAAGINAGGFADDHRSGKRYPLATTIVDGQYMGGFYPTFKDLFFVGINENLRLIGGKFSRQDQLDQLKPMFGASFVPILMLDGHKQSIPKKWLTSPKRAARTIIGDFKHGQLLFLIIEGTDDFGRTGATLPELQGLLSRLEVMDAYNLDGGGSTTLVWNNRVMNRIPDGQLRPLATHFLFFR